MKINRIVVLGYVLLVFIFNSQFDYLYFYIRKAYCLGAAKGRCGLLKQNKSQSVSWSTVYCDRRHTS